MEWFSVSDRERESAFAFSLQRPPWFPPCSPSHGFLGTLFSSDTERMAPPPKSANMGNGHAGTGVMSCKEKNPIYRHRTSKVICASITSYLLIGIFRVNVLRVIDGRVQSEVCKHIEPLSTTPYCWCR